jgi:hypothetical protein
VFLGTENGKTTLPCKITRNVCTASIYTPKHSLLLGFGTHSLSASENATPVQISDMRKSIVFPNYGGGEFIGIPKTLTSINMTSYSQPPIYDWA